jgi:hypothetical protein
MRFDNVAGGRRMSDPLLVLLHVQAALLDDTDANINIFPIDDRVPCGVGIDHAHEEAEGEGVKSIGGMPIGGHPLVVCVVVLCRRHTVVLYKPIEYVNGRCWKAVRTPTKTAVTKMLVRAAFIVTMSALVFLLRACHTHFVVRSFSSMHAV